MSEYIRSAFREIWSHKMRSFLTMLGVIIGIASIIAIVSTIKGTNDQIMHNLIGAGNNCVTVSLQQGEDDYYFDYGVPRGVQITSDEQMEEIRNLNKAEDATFYLYRSYVDRISAGNRKLDGGSIRGIDLHYLNTCGYEIYQGRGFAESDYQNFQKVILLDKVAVTALFLGEDPVGKVVDINGEPFTVVGLLRKAEEFEPEINSFSEYMMYHENEYGTLYIPDAVWPILYQFDEPKNCIVRAKDVEDMRRIGQETAKIMNRSVISEDNGVTYKAEDILEKAQNQQELNKSTNSLLIWVASIALLVGGIGVMNIMLVSVTERTSEIGLKKAIGAKKKNIMIQFLTESAVLTGIGGVIGIITGIVLAKVISLIAGTPASVSVPSIILGVAFSMVIGIVFGLLPSYKAANLNPIDALRRE